MNLLTGHDHNQWQRPSLPVKAGETPLPAMTASGVTLSLPSTVSTTLTIKLHLDHQPLRFGLHADLQRLLMVKECDQETLLKRMWGYIKSNGLLEKDMQTVKVDAGLSRVGLNMSGGVRRFAYSIIRS